MYMNKTESIKQFFRLGALDAHKSKVMGTYLRPAGATGVGFGLIG